ncbi:MAG: acpS [Nocardioidaceae bacterium]|nr:acpS [Nocardioidaceae bacterium]
MIIGVGIDVVDIARFNASLARTPHLRERLFVPAEAVLPPHSLAARFAAKEALAKALGAPGNLEWHHAEVVKDSTGRPSFSMIGTVLSRAEELGAAHVHLSLSHDAGIASAMVVLEG